MAPLTVQLELIESMPIRSPHIRTKDSWVVLGFGENLEAATYDALDGATTLLEKRLGVRRAVAFALAGVTVDLRITQIVNGTFGVHAVLPDSALGTA
jgi:acetamidase/formamidase